MHLSMTILLIGLGQAGETTTEHRLLVDRNPEDLYEAPVISPIHDGLPQPQVAPEDGRWVGKREWPAGVFLPMALNLELRRYHRACERLPGVFQVQLDDLRVVHAAEVAQAVAVAVARERARWVRRGLDAPPLAETGLPDWLETALWVVGGVTAVGVGVLIGWGARGLAGQ